MRKSYVCIKKEENTQFEHFVVGYHHSEKGWVTESVHLEADMAINRMNYLNGGNGWLISYLEDCLSKLEVAREGGHEETGEKKAVAESFPDGKRKELRMALLRLKGEGPASQLNLHLLRKQEAQSA